MNRRFSTLAACTFALLAAGCGGGGDTEETAALVKTGQALEAKLGAPGANARMPGKDDADVKAFDSEAEKGLTALGSDRLPVQGMDSYEKLCGPAAKIIAAYASAGVGTNADGTLQTDDRAKVAAMSANVERYMDQMFTPLLFAAHCTAVHIPKVEEQVDSKPEGKKAEAMAQIRNGAFGQAAGLLQIVGDPSLDEAKRRKALDLIARDAGNFAIAMSPEQRQQFARLADAVGQAMPAAKAQADRIKAAASKAPCGKLCSA
ncbi:MAG: hypothetical protein JOZ90_00195 [Alphaproteobacteria bacterium]|nr:hypothetical protein [Alphaproteobacteria bacterium]MBV9370954.1 hypothetical protein [Alphaproteobacteria bacterium]MBV9899497.1 hypothetical protein [Alphaproteobacteria bacterium]